MNGPGPGESAPTERPDVGLVADLARIRVHPAWVVFCFAIAFLIYLRFVPRFLLFCSPPSGDQPFYLMDTVSLVQDHDLNIKNNYDTHDEEKFFSLAPHPPGFVGMSVPRPLGRQLTASVARPAEEQYSVHPPGLPLLLAPAWAIGGRFSLWWPATIVAMCLIGALAALNAFLLAHELTGSVAIAVAVWAGIAFSNPLMTYSYLIFAELAAGLLLIYAFRRLALGWRANGPVRLLLIGACIGYLPWLAWRCALIAMPLGFYAAWQWWRARQRTGNVKQLPPGAVMSGVLLAAPVVTSVALIVKYALFRYGRPLPSSREPGVEVVFYWPWLGRSSLVHFINNSFGLLFDIQWGLLTYAPIYLLAAVGFVAMMRARPADRRLAVWMAGCLLPYLILIAAYQHWNGVWCPPARYQTVFVPVLAAPLALSLRSCRSWLYRILYGLLALWGVAVMAIMLLDPHRMWPFSDTARQPWNGLFSGGVFDWLAQPQRSPVRYDLRHVLPSFMTPDPATQPISTGAVIVVAFVLVFLSSLSIRRIASSNARKDRTAAGLRWLGAAMVLSIGWLLMNAQYLRSPTVLEELHRWQISRPMVETHGMTYLDGKLYIASMGPRSAVGSLQQGVGELGVFDPANGSYTSIQPISGQGALPYYYPGDVKTGPDHLLYFLNNGPGPQALYVMRPDGYVVRQVALGGKAPIAIGFNIGPDGKLYATDMGRVHQFSPQGGQELAAWGGPRGSFNNIAGITVGPDGIIYVAEQSEKRIHEFDGNGLFLRTVDLGTQPWQMVISGDWLEIGCEGGILSLNRRTNNVHTSRVTPDRPLLGVTALAYGQDNTLYVLARNAIIAYAVKH